MGENKGFLKYNRDDFHKEPTSVRKTHCHEFYEYLPEEEIKHQGGRCMDCGIPFCQWGCPVTNLIPEWNDLIYHGRWEEAIQRLHATNNFPEFTGRICPAPCENSCVLGINMPAVTIKNIELAIVETAFQKGWIVPAPPKRRSGKTVAVIGSGPAGLACADQLNKYGHKVTVFEKNEAIGGLLTFGIPDFKLEKKIVERRVDLMDKEGVHFKTGVHVGVDISILKLKDEYDALVLAGGAEQHRTLDVPGNDLKGVYSAMTYLVQQNRVNRGIKIDPLERIDVKDKHVIILGGGDTGSDCVGTANRQGAKTLKQLELLSRPPDERDLDNPWPYWAYVYRKSTSHEEGVEQDYSILTKELKGKDGVLKKLGAIRLQFGPKDPKTGRRPMTEISDSYFELDCDYLFLAMGFTGPVKNGMIEELGVELDQRSNVRTNKHFMTSLEGVFAAGDMHMGQSLVVRAIQEGRNAAEGANAWLLKKTV